MNKCKICGNNCQGEYCFIHKPRKPIRKRKGLVTNKQKKSKSYDNSEMIKLFIRLFGRRGRVSEVSGERLFSPPSTLYFHHILPKNKYPEAALDEENIIILSPEEHGNVEINMYRYEKINNKRDYLLKKYNYI